MEGLFHSKWYSHWSLKEIPLGYWMWRADWKLKQLTQGALFDDATREQIALRPGVNVPGDYPDLCSNRRTGRRRCWIVCRQVRLRKLGEKIVLVRPDEAQLGRAAVGQEGSSILRACLTPGFGPTMFVHFPSKIGAQQVLGIGLSG